MSTRASLSLCSDLFQLTPATKKKKTTIIQTTTEININSNRREGIVGDDTGGEKGKLRSLLPYWKTNSSSPQLA